MKVEVEVISKVIIKPSSPTPSHLRHYHFSFLDQINPPIYSPLVLFYELNGETQPSIAEISKHLRNSLAEVLTLFYPLAGRVKIDKYFVECNDEGIPYLEAHVKNSTLRDVLNNPIPIDLHKFLPFKLHEHVANEFALGIQLNIFECGGFAVGLCISHKLADALSMLMFTKTWAAIARGETDEAKIDTPQFVSAALFAPKDISKTGYDGGANVTTNQVTKRFVFHAPTVEDLREKYKLGFQNNEKPPSRVESLSAFMWARFAAATRDDDGDHDKKKLHSVIHTVNLRSRFDPPLDPSSFGNIYRITWTPPIVSNGGGVGDAESCYDMITKVREEISKIDKEYVKKLQQGDELLRLLNPPSHGSEVSTSTYSSLCRFPLYETDFSWGSPAWVGLPPLPMKNLVVFADTKEAGGIEAYVTLSEEAMTKFESDPLLQARVGTGQVGSPITGSACQNRPDLIKLQNLKPQTNPKQTTVS